MQLIILNFLWGFKDKYEMSEMCYNSMWNGGKEWLYLSYVEIERLWSISGMNTKVVLGGRNQIP